MERVHQILRFPPNNNLTSYMDISMDQLIDPTKSRLMKTILYQGYVSRAISPSISAYS